MIKIKPSTVMAKIYETDKTIDNLWSINMSPEEEEKRDNWKEMR